MTSTILIKNGSQVLRLEYIKNRLEIHREARCFQIYVEFADGPAEL